MLDVIILLVTVGLIASAIWLYLSAKKIETQIKINTSTLSQPITQLPTIPSGPPAPCPMIPPPYYQRPQRKLEREAPPLRPPRRIESPPRIVGYDGWAHIPIRVYEGDSSNITVDLRPSIRKPLEGVSSIRFQRVKDKDDVSLNLNVLRHSGQEEFLELEMLAAGFTVEGDKKQKQPLSAHFLQYQWNCLFENSGNHTFVIVFRVINGSDILEIGRIQQSIRVVKIDHLTQRQVWVLTSVAGILSGGLAILEVARKLGFW